MPEHHLDLTSMSLHELLALRSSIDAEISARGHARTATALVGELAERIVADAYAGELARAGERSFDVVGADGLRIQVKARSLPRGEMRHFAFHDLDFDAAVVMCFDRTTSELLWARELSREVAAGLAKPHASDGWRIRMTAAHEAGIDVTETLRTAYVRLR
jgi:hypothetical protein